MRDEKMITHISRYVQDAKKAVAGVNEVQVKNIAMFFAHQFIEEIKQGLEGTIDYENAPFFEKVDRMFEEAAAPPSGCYFCDRSIDGNAEPFDDQILTHLKRLVALVDKCASTAVLVDGNSRDAVITAYHLK